MDKRGIAMSFNWIFAILVGGFILFLAIYTASQFINIGESKTYTESAAEIVSLLAPLETGLASGKSSKVEFDKETRLRFDCSYLDNRPFGQQSIRFSEKTFGEKYGDESPKVGIKNSYVFSEKLIEGNEIALFSKSYSSPFKIADIVIILSEDYCFLNSPNEVKDEIVGLNIEKIKFADEVDDCNGKIVCFDSNDVNCDLVVNGLCDNCDSKYEYGKVVDDNEKYYADNLLYGAIFSDNEIYECNVKRLGNKFNELALIYLNKINIIDRKGCKSLLGVNLQRMREGMGKLDNSRDLINLYNVGRDIDKINDGVSTGCRVW